ncbi:uncharacterized protein LOC113746684 [Scomber scombrus]|uniref:Uncharacterized protein LOC113746684 n=1 Tax=Scomber scombrus TaxID=13677 RepID=A0AAV1N6K5_SCOSC
MYQSLKLIHQSSARGNWNQSTNHLTDAAETNPPIRLSSAHMNETHLNTKQTDFNPNYDHSNSHGGICDIKEHASEENEEERTQGVLLKFLVPQASPPADSVIAAELAHIHHTVKHSGSYNSSDCALKLTHQTLSDFNIAKKRKKAKAVVTDVLAPKPVDELRNSTYTDNIDADPKRQEAYLGKQRAKWRKDRETGKKLSVSELNDRERQELKAFLWPEDRGQLGLSPAALSLAHGRISYDNMERFTERLHLVGRLSISMDELYDECVTANSVLERLYRASGVGVQGNS